MVVGHWVRRPGVHGGSASRLQRGVFSRRLEDLSALYACFSSIPVAPVVVESVMQPVPTRQPWVLGEATDVPVASVEPTGPVRLAPVGGLPVDGRGRDRQDLRAAGRTPVHVVRKAPHLRVPALAGVATDRVWEPGYLAEGLEKHPTEYAPARLTTKRVVAEGAELVDLAEGAGEGMCRGIC